MLGPFDALQELEAQAQSGFGFEIFVQVRLGEQKQSFAVDAFRGEVLDKRLRRAEPREKSSYLFAGPRVGVVGQPRRRIVEGAAPTPLLRRRRRRRDATRRAAGVSRTASAGHGLSLLLPPRRGSLQRCTARRRSSVGDLHAVDAPCTHLWAAYAYVAAVSQMLLVSYSPLGQISLIPQSKQITGRTRLSGAWRFNRVLL